MMERLQSGSTGGAEEAEEDAVVPWVNELRCLGKGWHTVMVCAASVKALTKPLRRSRGQRRIERGHN